MFEPQSRADGPLSGSGEDLHINLLKHKVEFHGEQLARLVSRWRQSGHPELDTSKRFLDLWTAEDQSRIDSPINARLYFVSRGSISEGKALAADEYRLSLANPYAPEENYLMLTRVIASNHSEWSFEVRRGVTLLYSSDLGVIDTQHKDSIRETSSYISTLLPILRNVVLQALDGDKSV